jgi:predicted component of type VI protein secretion system
MYGELVPLGGGDPIPLLKKSLVIGRRENCDIVLRFPNVSARHCQLTLKNGYWYIQDLDSRNGIKVNGVRVPVGEKRVDPGATISIAKHQYEMRYDPAKLGATGAPPMDDDTAHVFGQSLLERAGLTGKSKDDDMPEEYRRRGENGEDGSRRGKRKT